MDTAHHQYPVESPAAAFTADSEQHQFGHLPALQCGELEQPIYIQKQQLITYDELSLLYHNQAIRDGDDLGEDNHSFESLLGYCWSHSQQIAGQWRFANQLVTGVELRKLGEDGQALSKADLRQLDNHPAFDESLIWPFTRWAMERLLTKQQKLTPSFLLQQYGELEIEGLYQRAANTILALSLDNGQCLSDGLKGQLAKAALAFSLEHLFPRLAQWKSLDQQERNAVSILIYATALYCPPVYGFYLQLLWNTSDNLALQRQLQRDLPWLVGKMPILHAWRVLQDNGQLSAIGQHICPLISHAGSDEPWLTLQRLVTHHQEMIEALLALSEHHLPTLKCLANVHDHQRVQHHLRRVLQTLSVTVPALGNRAPDCVLSLQEKLQSEQLSSLLNQTQTHPAASKLLVGRLLTGQESNHRLMADAMERAESIAQVPDLNAMANEPERLIQYAERRKASMDQLADQLAHLSETHSDALAVAQSSLSQVEDTQVNVGKLAAEKHCLEKRIVALEQQQSQLKNRLRESQQRNQELVQALSNEAISIEDVDLQTSSNRLLSGDGRCLDAARVADHRFAKLNILPSAIASATHCLYPNGNRVFEALSLLAQAANAGWDGEALHQALSGPSGIEYLNQDYPTGNKFKWLGVRQFGGAELECQHHLSFGSAEEPERACHLFFDFTKDGISVAYIGSAKHG